MSTNEPQNDPVRSGRDETQSTPVTKKAVLPLEKIIDQTAKSRAAHSTMASEAEKAPSPKTETISVDYPEERESTVDLIDQASNPTPGNNNNR